MLYVNLQTLETSEGGGKESNLSCP